MGPQLKHGRFRLIAVQVQKELTETTETDAVVPRSSAVMTHADPLIRAVYKGDFTEVINPYRWHLVHQRHGHRVNTTDHF